MSKYQRICLNLQLQLLFQLPITTYICGMGGRFPTLPSNFVTVFYTSNIVFLETSCLYGD